MAFVKTGSRFNRKEGVGKVEGHGLRGNSGSLWSESSDTLSPILQIPLGVFKIWKAFILTHYQKSYLLSFYRDDWKFAAETDRAVFNVCSFLLYLSQRPNDI